MKITEIILEVKSKTDADREWGPLAPRDRSPVGAPATTKSPTSPVGSRTFTIGKNKIRSTTNQKLINRVNNILKTDPDLGKTFAEKQKLKAEHENLVLRARVKAKADYDKDIPSKLVINPRVFYDSKKNVTERLIYLVFALKQVNKVLSEFVKSKRLDAYTRMVNQSELVYPYMNINS
jgi:hypothetical protein